MAQSVKNLPAMQETRVRSLGRKFPQEKEMASYKELDTTEHSTTTGFLNRKTP